MGSTTRRSMRVTLSAASGATKRSCRMYISTARGSCHCRTISLWRSLSAIPRCRPKGPLGGAACAPTWGPPWAPNSAAVGGRGTGAAVVVRQVANSTVEPAADQWAAVAVDLRAGAVEVAADCLAVGSPPVRIRCSCPAAAWAGAVVTGAAAAVDCDIVAVAVVGNGRVVAAAVAVAMPDVVILRKLLPILPDNAAAAGVGVVGAV